MSNTERKEKLLVRKQEYCRVFDEETSKVVLEDLAFFCRANYTTFHQDPRVHAVLEGRREVWLRIQDHLNLPADTFLESYGINKVENLEEREHE